MPDQNKKPKGRSLKWRAAITILAFAVSSIVGYFYRLAEPSIVGAAAAQQVNDSVVDSVSVRALSEGLVPSAVSWAFWILILCIWVPVIVRAFRAHESGSSN